MYADRDHRRGGVHPGSMGMALVVSGAMIAGLTTSVPTITALIGDAPITIYDVPADPPPPPPDRVPPPPRGAKTATIPRVDASASPVRTSLDTGLVMPPGPPTIDLGSDAGLVGGTGPIVIDPPKPPPVIVQPGVDPRYADDFQPIYPAGERRAGHEGRVVARVLIGTDGRVKRIERVSAASDAFWRATEERAFAKWRFTPATRDGVPIEAWRTMSLSFVMSD